MRPLNELLKDYPAIKAFPELVEAVRTRDTRIAELEAALRSFVEPLPKLPGLSAAQHAYSHSDDGPTDEQVEILNEWDRIRDERRDRARVLLTDQTPPVSFGEGETR